MVVLSACGHRSEKNHWFTADISSYKPNNCTCKLYAEVYQGGWMNSKSYYLTDSTNFRIYVGDYYEENEMISYHCSGDSIFATKSQNTGVLYYDINGKTSTIYKNVSIQKFSLKQLKKRNNL